MAAIGWQGWALMSAVFAALTAILAKVGVEGVDPDIATFIRTLVIAVILATLSNLYLAAESFCDARASLDPSTAVT